MMTYELSVRDHAHKLFSKYELAPRDVENAIDLYVEFIQTGNLHETYPANLDQQILRWLDLDGACLREALTMGRSVNGVEVSLTIN